MALKVLLTRSTNVYVGLSERAHFANRNQADLFISYHLNAASTVTAKGYEDFTFPTQNQITINSRDKYHMAILPALRELNQTNRGKKVANFAVLRLTIMPAVLVELGFITNAAEYDTISGASNFEMLAQAHAQAIKDVLMNMGKANNALVVLDPGHGGSDPGAVANGFTEASYVLRFSLRVKEILLEHKPNAVKPKEHENEIIKEIEVLKNMKLNNTTRRDIQELNNKAVEQGIFLKLIATRNELVAAKKTPGWSDKYNAIALEDMTDDDLKNKLLSYVVRKEIKNK